MNSSSIIFLLDDDQDFCDQIAELLAPTAKVTTFTKPEELLSHMKKYIPDLVIVDLNLHHTTMDGFSVISLLKEKPNSHLFSILLLSGADSSDILQKAFRSGIDDYIPKPVMPQIFLSKIENVLYNSNKKIHTNALTGLPGAAIIESEYLKRMKTKEIFAVGYLDLDYFKAFNDEKGVKIGDEAIKLVSRILHNVRRRFSREQLFIGHLGGDDFFLIGSEVDIEQAVTDAYKHFDHGCRQFFNQEELTRGFYRGNNREGEEIDIRLLTNSTAILTLESGKFYSFEELTEIAAKVKKKAKSIDGNSIAKEIL